MVQEEVSSGQEGVVEIGWFKLAVLVALLFFSYMGIKWLMNKIPKNFRWWEK